MTFLSKNLVLNAKKLHVMETRRGGKKSRFLYCDREFSVHGSQMYATDLMDRNIFSNIN